MLAAVAISLTVFELGHGILFCATGKSHKDILDILLAFGFVLSVLRLGTTGAWEKLRTDVDNGVFDLPGNPIRSDFDIRAYNARSRPLVILDVIIAVFCMLMSLTVAALGIWVTSVVRHSEKSDILGQVRYRRQFPVYFHDSFLTPAAFAPIGHHSPAHERIL